MGSNTAVTQTEITIRYTLTRSEVAQSYLQAISKSPEYLRKIITLAAICAIAQMLFRVLISRRLGGPEILSAFIVFAAVLVLLPVMLFLSAKTEERVLTISPAGISTTIGKKSGQIPWNAVRVIIDGGTFVLIARNNGNAFFIPNRAFSGPTDRSRFLQQLASWRSILS